MVAPEAQRLIAYARVSTDEQADSGAGLAAQQTALERAFVYERWVLVETIVDEGQSGKDIHRPGLRRALEMIAAGDADGLAVAKLDRLSRSVVDFADLVEWFDLAGAVLVALDIKLDTSAPGSELVANVLMAVAQWERKTIGERTRLAMAAKRARGERTGRPSIADFPELLEYIQRLHAEGLGLSEIARRLSDEEIPTVRGGVTWRASAIQVAIGYERPPKRRRRGELPEIPRRRR